MQYRRLILPVLLSLVLSGGYGMVQAADNATHTMAAILLKLNHYPSEAEKATLQKIVDDKAATAPEQAVAQSLIHLQHHVSAEDKPKLQAIVDDKTAPADLRDMSKIIISLNHTPSAAEKETLQKILHE
jgi:hypothetical protein